MSLVHQEHEFMWIQKWRGQTFDEIALPDAVKREFNYYVEQKQSNHLLIHSPSPGTGKTTSAVALAFAMGCKKPFIVNASKDTDLGTIRTNVYQYATGASLLNRGMKVVVLDEIDRLSANAQDALKGIMEEVSHCCAFVLTTNHLYRVDEKLRSRCALINYTFTEDDRKSAAVQIAKRCCDKLDLEGVKYDRRVVAQVVMKLSPDFRSVIMKLQQMYIRYGEINAASLAELESMDLSDLVDILFDKTYADVLKWVTNNAGNIGTSFYRDLYDAMKPRIANDAQKTAQVLMELGEEQKWHAQTPDVFLHVARVMTLLMGIIR